MKFFRVVFIVVIIGVLLFSTIFFIPSVSAIKVLNNEYVVVIDAGHGGIDGGVVSSNGTKESDLNLDISKKINNLFNQTIISSILTRTTQNGLYGLATKGFKKRDMLARKNIIEQAKAQIVVSIHINSCPYPSRRGVQVFYKIGSEESKDLAQRIQNSFNSLPNVAKEVEALKGDYYILNCTDKISVLVECGFLTNKIDFQLLLLEEYRQSVAYTIFESIQSFILEKGLLLN